MIGNRGPQAPREVHNVSFLYDHNRNLRHREGRTRLSPHVRQAGDTEHLRQGSARGARLRDEFDCGTIRTYKSLYPLRKPFHGEGEASGIAFLPGSTERQALPDAGAQVDRAWGLLVEVAKMRDLGPDEHPVHMIGTAMNGGEIADPQRVLAFPVQRPQDLPSNLNHLGVLRADLRIVNGQVAEDHGFLRVENVQAEVKVWSARARGLDLDCQFLPGFGLESKEVDVSRLADGPFQDRGHLEDLRLLRL